MSKPRCKNEYTPWKATGETELEYFKRLYLEAEVWLEWCLTHRAWITWSFSGPKVAVLLHWVEDGIEQAKAIIDGDIDGDINAAIDEAGKGGAGWAASKAAVAALNGNGMAPEGFEKK